MTVLLSRSEIKSEVEKAIRGVGFEWGRAKDGGAMAVWLATHDQVFLGGLLRGIETFDATSTSPDQGTVFGPTDAMMLAEYVVASGASWSGHVVGVRFIIAGLGIVTAEQNASLSLHDDDGLIAIAHGGDVWVDPNYDNRDRGVTISLGSGEGNSESRGNLVQLARSSQTAHAASRSCWERLGAFAHKVYVKETEEKRRSGAGAGDIDNS